MKHILAILIFAAVASQAFAASAGISLLFTWDCPGTPTEYRIYRQVATSGGAVSRVLVKTVTGAPAPKTAEVTGIQPGTHTFLISAIYPPLETGQPPVELFSSAATATLPNLTSPENIVVKIQITVGP